MVTVATVTLPQMKIIRNNWFPLFPCKPNDGGNGLFL